MNEYAVMRVRDSRMEGLVLMASSEDEAEAIARGDGFLVEGDRFQIGMIIRRIPPTESGGNVSRMTVTPGSRGGL